MEYTFISLIIPAFIAGVITFLAPCTLPIVPGYLGFISGASLDELKSSQNKRQMRRKIFLNGVLFVIGFSVVFIILGTVVAFVSASLLAPYRLWLASIGGAFIILFGFAMMGVFWLPFVSRRGGFALPSREHRGKPLSSFFIGSTFALGWTPCVGPILASVLLFASTANTAFQGAFLLFVFSLGLALPFLFIAFAIGASSRYISYYMNVVARFRVAIFAVSGIILGALLNPLLIKQGQTGLALRIGTIDTGMRLGIVPQDFPSYLFPLFFSLLLAYIGSRFFKHVDAFSFIGGLFFVYLGVLLLTNNLGILIIYGYELFQFIEYEELLNHYL